MTDEQIIKALECCMKGNNFGGCCPYDDEGDICEECTSKLAKDALDLIKRQQADIEDLIKQRDEQFRINRQVVRRNGQHIDERNRLKAEIEKEVDLNRELFEKMAKDEAEIERLEADREALINGQITLQKMYAEAIKKFAERLKEKAEYYSDLPFKTVDVEDIDNLVKEMTEGKDDE